MEIISMSIVKEKGEDILNLTLKSATGITPVSLSSKTDPEAYGKVMSLVTKLQTGALTTEAATAEIVKVAMPITGLTAAFETHKRSIGSNLYIKDNRVYFGDEILEDTLSAYILTLLNSEYTPIDEVTWNALTRFLDNLHQNVNPEIRKQLFRWMNYELNDGVSFTITDDGCFVGYKGVNGSVLNPTSVNKGTAFVNGVKHTGSIPNPIGGVISMPRSEVQFDPTVGCSTGLHVGTYDYASNWGELLMTVKVNPRDVVSVPTECESQKIRCCEYTVIGTTDGPLKSRVIISEDNEQYTPEYAESKLPQDGVHAAILSLNEGDEVIVKYRRNNGDVVTVDGTVASTNYDRFVLRLSAGGHRTIMEYKVHTITPKLVKSRYDSKPHSDQWETPQVGDKVNIDYYSKTTGTVKNIVGEVRTVDDSGLLVYSDKVGHRKLKWTNVIRLTNKELRFA